MRDHRLADTAKRYRTICYVDGFNLYYGIKDSGWTHCKWLDIHKMAMTLVRLPFVLTRTKYFTARISGAHPGDSEDQAHKRNMSRKRQSLYLDALDTLRCLDIYEGTYYLKRDYCRSCRSDFFRPEEKMTDVHIATQLVADAFLNRFDSAIVVSGDSDLAPPIRVVKEHFPDKRLVVAFPPCRSSSHLRMVADNVIQIWPRTLERSQLPAKIPASHGVMLCRPCEWGK